jgi:hypothetical protein
MNKALIIAAAALIFGCSAADALKTTLIEWNHDRHATILQLGAPA